MAVLVMVFCPIANANTAGNVVVIQGNGQDQTQEVQALLSQNGNYQFQGIVKTRSISITGHNITLDFAPGAAWQPSAEVDILFTCNDCNLNIGSLLMNGVGYAQEGIRVNGGTLVFGDVTFINFGTLRHQATNIVAGMYLNRVKSVQGGTLKASHLNSVGNGIFGDNVGAARGLVLFGSGPYNIGEVTVDLTGSDAEEDDAFQVNVGNTGGVINKLTVIYNGNTRRAAKFQSGQNVINNIDIHKAKDFVPVSSQTDAGRRNFNCVSWEADTSGSLDIMGGKVDASGFTRGVGNNAPLSTASIRVHPGVTLIGATKHVIRVNPQTGKSENTETRGFYTSVFDSGSGIEGATVINFSVGATIRANGAYSKDTTYEYPGRIGIEAFVPLSPMFGNRVVLLQKGL
ncbi:MAG TPA: hypothetical protein VFT64_02195 [Rickettsiales bacterium]|nr:hypothetical protein [Rickettsiales bacterium]